MSDARAIKAEQEMFQRNLKTELCVGRCAYNFQATKVRQDPEKQIEIVQEGIMFCGSCAHVVDVAFDDEEG